MEKFTTNQQMQPDGFTTPEVREWSLEKYKLVGSYCDIFTSGMKNKWNQLVYIDLFAGAGFVKIKETGKVFKNSALLAMSLPVKFTKYILCEQDPQKCEALNARVLRDYPEINFEIIPGDSNKNVDKVIKAIPPYSKGNTLLPFCFVDPYSLNLHFSTIKALANGLMDFLILQALHMDANRNFDVYIREENKKIEDYLGVKNWRELLESGSPTYKKDFVRFLADQYQSQMVRLGYQEAKHMHHIKSNERNLPLYYLAFYSKHSQGVNFFKEVQKRVTSQQTLF
jgi:three-Cys-motif partner protein